MDEETQRSRRATLISRTFVLLQFHEDCHPGERSATILRLRTDNPKESIEQLSARLSEQVGTPITPTSFRKALQHARHRFLDSLLGVIRADRPGLTPKQLQAEIESLGFGRFGKGRGLDDEGPDEDG
jgi:hypothetical protein